MVQSEESPTYFMIRIWGEEEQRFVKPAKLRGHITHIPSHRRCYFENLSDILTFIEPYLEKLGIESDSE